MSKIVIKKPTDYIKISSTITLIYGQPSSRKTTFAGTAPNPIMFDFDEGVHRLAKKYRVPYIPVEQLRNWGDVMEMIDDPILDDYDTLIFDSVTKMADYLADFVIRQNIKNGKQGGGLSLQGFGALGEAFRNFIKKIKTKGKHIVFVAHDKEYKEGDSTRLRPDIVGSNLGVVTRDADLIGYMEIVNNEAVVQFTPTDRFYAKNSCQLEPQLRASETTIAEIIERYEEGINSESVEMERYKKVIETVTADLEKCEDAIDLSGAYEKLKTLDHVLTSKLESWEMFKQKAEELGLYFDKGVGAFLVKEEQAESSEQTGENQTENPNPQGGEDTAEKPSENAENDKPHTGENVQAETAEVAENVKPQGGDSNGAEAETNGEVVKPQKAERSGFDTPTVPSKPKATKKTADVTGE